MTKLSFGAHPFLLGFEQLERLVERTADNAVLLAAVGGPKWDTIERSIRP